MTATRDYGTAWAAYRGRCFRLVYGDGHGRPDRCPHPVAGSVWGRHNRRWLALDACEERLAQLDARPTAA